MKFTILLISVAALFVFQCAAQETDSVLDDEEITARKSMLEVFKYLLDFGALDEDPEEAIRSREGKPFVELRDEAISILRDFTSDESVDPQLLISAKQALEILEDERDGKFTRLTADEKLMVPEAALNSLPSQQATPAQPSIPSEVEVAA